MATNKTEKYYRILLLLAKGCTVMTRAMVMKHVKDSTPAGHHPDPWSLDQFLFTNQQLLFHYPNGKRRHILDRHRRLVYPNNGDIDINQWDLLLTVNVLLDVCSLPPMVKMHLEMLKKRRNTLCHSSDADMSDKTYEEYLEQLKMIIDQCLIWIGDSALTTELNEVTREIEKGSLIRFQEFMTNMEQWRLDENEISSQLKTMEATIKTISQEQFSTIESKLDSIIQCVKPDTRVPGTKLTMEIEAPTNEQKRQICQQLISIVDPKLSKLPVSRDVIENVKKAMAEAMKEMLGNGISLLSVKEECVAFYLQCVSFQTLFSLWHRCVNGEITQMFKRVESSIKTIPGHEHVEINVYLTEDEFLGCFNLIVRELANEPNTVFVQNELLKEEMLFGKTKDVTTQYNIQETACPIDTLETLKNILKTKLDNYEDKLQSKTEPSTLRNVGRQGAADSGIYSVGATDSGIYSVDSCVLAEMSIEEENNNPLIVQPDDQAEEAETVIPEAQAELSLSKHSEHTDSCKSDKEA